MKITESIPYIWIHSQRPLLYLILLSSNIRKYKISSWKAFRSSAILTCGKAASKWLRLSLIILGEKSNCILCKGCQTFQSMGWNTTNFHLEKAKFSKDINHTTHYQCATFFWVIMIHKENAMQLTEKLRETMNKYKLRSIKADKTSYNRKITKNENFVFMANHEKGEFSLGKPSCSANISWTACSGTQKGKELFGLLNLISYRGQSLHKTLMFNICQETDESFVWSLSRLQ